MAEITRMWLMSLLGAFIGGLANGILLIIVDPVGFNPFTNFSKLGLCMLVSGIVNAAFYLKKSPLPGMTNSIK